MKPPVRLLVSDIDGTLVRHDKNLSDAVVGAIGRAREAGVEVSLISARPPSGMLWIAQRLQLTNAIGAFNGGTIVRPDGSLLAAARLDPVVAGRAMALLSHPAVMPWLFADGQWYATTLEHSHVARERKAANVEPVITQDFGSLLARVDKIVGVSHDPQLLEGLEESVALALGRAATVARSQPYYLDITAPAANKGDGITALAAAAGVALEEVVVIGDERNDLAMFARAGLSIAMAQGPATVRAAADRVTWSNDEDGVAHAIDEIILGGAAK